MSSLEPMTRAEAIEYAPQWGSYMRAGDPGAYMYSEFPDARHAIAALDYIESDCLPIARRGDCCDADGPCESDLEELARLALYLESIAGRRWRVTFGEVTEESSAEGDYARTGFVDRNGDRVDVNAPGVNMTLREAIELWADFPDSAGWMSPDCSHGRVRWIDSEPMQEDGGREVTFGLHAPDGMTRATAGRLARLLGGTLA